MAPMFAFALALAAHSVVGGPITWEIPATRIGPLLEKLSAITGTKYECDPVLAGEVALVSVHGVEATDLEKRLADVVCGTWVQNKDARRLVLDRDRDESDREKAAKDSFKRVKDEIDRRVAFANKTFDPASTPAWPYRSEHDTPVQRMIFKLVSNLSVRDLTEVMAGRVQSYAWPPVGGLKTLIGDVRSMVSKFSQEVSSWEPFLAKNGPIGQETFIPQFSLPGKDLQPEDITGLLLTVKADSGNGGITVELVIRLSGQLRSASVTSQIRPEELKESSPAFPERAVSLSRASKSQLEILQWYPGLGRTVSFNSTFLAGEWGQVCLSFVKGGSFPTPVVNEEDRQLLLNPESNDPLSFFPTEIVFQALDKESKNIVAALPDSMLKYTYMKSVSTVPLQRAIDYRDVSLKTDGTWQIVAPVHPSVTRTMRLDRKLLGDALSEAEHNLCLSIKTLGQLSRRLDKRSWFMTKLFHTVSRTLIWTPYGRVTVRSMQSGTCYARISRRP